MTEVVQNIEKLYTSENLYKENPLSDWYGDLIRGIDSRITEAKYNATRNILQELKETIDRTNEKVQRIGVSLVFDLPQVGNLEIDLIRNESGHRDKLFLEKVNDEYLKMIDAWNSFKGNATKCEALFKRKTYGFKRGEHQKIVALIRNIMKCKPSRNISGSELLLYKNEALKPLKKLPVMGDESFEEFFRCVEWHYASYLRVRSNSHDVIRRLIAAS